MQQLCNKWCINIIHHHHHGLKTDHRVKIYPFWHSVNKNVSAQLLLLINLATLYKLQFCCSRGESFIRAFHYSLRCVHDVLYMQSCQWHRTDVVINEPYVWIRPGVKSAYNSIISIPICGIINLWLYSGHTFHNCSNHKRRRLFKKEIASLIQIFFYAGSHTVVIHQTKMRTRAQPFK